MPRASKKKNRSAWAFFSTCMPNVIIPRITDSYISHAELLILPTICPPGESLSIAQYIHNLLMQVLPDSIFTNNPFKELFSAEMGAWFKSNCKFFFKGTTKYRFSEEFLHFCCLKTHNCNLQI